jgi:hypothetical protein
MSPEQQTPASVVERLRAVESSRVHGGFSADRATTNWYRNPDGPEAAALIERLSAELEGLRAEIERADEVLGRAGPFYAASIEGARKIILAALTQGEPQHGETYDRLHTFLFDRDAAIAGDPYSAEEMDESVRQILRIATQGESRQTGWVEWHGGENPVPGQVVECRLAATGIPDVPAIASEYMNWAGDIPGAASIIAYRVVTPAAPTPADGGGE